MKKKVIKQIRYTSIPIVIVLLLLIAANFLYKEYSVEGKVTNDNYTKLLNTRKQRLETVKIIAKSTVIYLSNFAIDGLKEKIKLDFKNNFIEAIEIKDNYLNETLVIAYKDENSDIVFTESLPDKFKLYNSIEEDIIEEKEYTSNKLGKVTIYFKDSSYYKKLVKLNSLEQSFLRNNSSINLCVSPNWAPFEKIENGKYVGISSDIMKIISTQLNLEFNLIRTNTWQESLEKIKTKQCDMLPLAVQTESRKEYLDFTKPYLFANIVIATRANVPFIDNLNTIDNKTFAILRGHYLFEDLKKRYPNTKIQEVQSIQEGLYEVETGQVFGYIDNSIVINHTIQKNFIGSVAISGKLNGQMEFSIATRKEFSILNDIFNKVLNIIDKQTKDTIYNKWIKTNYQIKTDYTLVLQLLIVFLIIIFITLYWNRKLTKLNRQLEKERNKAYEATKAKAKFLANMSHEIRTPMNSIIGMSHLILETDLKKEQKEYIEKIDKSANSLLRIINDILDFSKIEAGKIEFHNSSFSLREVISDCVDYIDLDLEEKDLEFILEYDENLSEYYFGDRLRVSQVLTNVLHNAVKFTSTGFVRLSLVQKTEKVIYIEIEDSGIGLTNDEKEKIFDSFSQGDLSSSKKYEGTGLGLAICRDLIHLMNGKIWIESQKNKGTTFFIEIELKPTKKDDSQIKTKNKPNFEGKNILLVEDNLLNQQIIEGLLKDTNINLKVVKTGQEAISILKNKNHNINIVLMDIQMPILDGYETTKIIRKFNKKTPILAISANTYEEDINKSLKSGMNEHLKKPIEVEKLYSSIEKYILK